MIPEADRPPSALLEIGVLAKGLFDAAYSSDWSAAAERVRALNESASALPDTLLKPELVAQLRSRLEHVGQTVSAHQRIETMDDANAITRLVADLAARFERRVPYDAVMLGYYGRQLELGIASGQPSTLSQASGDLSSTWDRLEPKILELGAVDEVRRFTDILVQLEAAQRPAEFIAPTRAALAGADRIEKLFRSSN